MWQPRFTRLGLMRPSTVHPAICSRNKTWDSSPAPSQQGFKVTQVVGGRGGSATPAFWSSVPFPSTPHPVPVQVTWRGGGAERGPSLRLKDSSRSARRPNSCSWPSPRPRCPRPARSPLCSRVVHTRPDGLPAQFPPVQFAASHFMNFIRNR